MSAKAPHGIIGSPFYAASRDLNFRTYTDAQAAPGRPDENAAAAVLDGRLWILGYLGFDWDRGLESPVSHLSSSLRRPGFRAQEYFIL